MSEFARARIAEEADQFFAVHSARTAENAVRQAAENIRVNSKQADRDNGAIADYLHELFTFWSNSFWLFVHLDY